MEAVHAKADYNDKLEQRAAFGSGNQVRMNSRILPTTTAIPFAATNVEYTFSSAQGYISDVCNNHYEHWAEQESRYSRSNYGRGFSI